MAEEEGRWDGVYYQIVQQGGGYEFLFDSVFSFLRRKTDFFTDSKKAEKVIAEAGAKHVKLFKEQDEKNIKEQAEKKRREDERLKKEKEAAEEKAKKLAENPPPPVEKPKEEEKQPEKKEEVKKDGEEKKEEEEDKTPPPKGNGGKTDKYVWTQTLEEAALLIDFPESIRAKNLNVQITPTKCQVQIKGGETLVDGEWYEQINADDTIWTLEPTKEGKVFKIAIQKWGNRNGWWDCMIKGHEKINTQKIQPETSKVSDLDGEMKGQVEKMMFDMRQKQAGLPSSDELEKRSKIEAFMKAHPEMDFSKAKIC